MGVSGFYTDNSVYYLDTTNRLIWGGKLGNKTMRYADGARFLVGLPGKANFVDEYGRLIYTKDGRVAGITTGVIKGYV